MEQILSAGGIIVNPRGQVLVITNDIGKTTLPKGTREEGELPIDTAAREVEEETGLRRFEVVRFLGVLSRPGFSGANRDSPSVMKHIHLFLFKADQRQLRPEAPDVKRAFWVKPQELPEVLSWREEAEFYQANAEAIAAVTA